MLFKVNLLLITLLLSSPSGSCWLKLVLLILLFICYVSWSRYGLLSILYIYILDEGLILILRLLRNSYVYSLLIDWVILWHISNNWLHWLHFLILHSLLLLDLVALRHLPCWSRRHTILYLLFIFHNHAVIVIRIKALIACCWILSTSLNLLFLRIIILIHIGYLFFLIFFWNLLVHSHVIIYFFVHYWFRRNSFRRNRSILIWKGFLIQNIKNIKCFSSFLRIFFQHLL